MIYDAIERFGFGHDIDSVFVELRDLYRRDYECFRSAGVIHSRLRYGRIDEIFRSGLQEFGDDLLERNDALGRQISHDFMLRV